MSGRAARAAKRRKFKQTLAQILTETFAEAVAQQVRFMGAWEAFMVKEGERLNA